MGPEAFEGGATVLLTESRDANGHTRRPTHRFQVTWIPLPVSLPIIRLSPDNPLVRLGRPLGRATLTRSPLSSMTHGRCGAWTNA